ncbi:phosphoglucosamine mutase [bacterium]|nr:phosphoglucosamine mutase [bacterium]
MGELFGTDGVRGKANENLTVDFVTMLGLSVGSILGKNCKEIILGRDTRLSSDMIASAFTAGLLASGMDVLDAGVITTPGIAYLVYSMGKWGGVVSASHNPFYENGIKLFNIDGFKLPEELEEEIEGRLREENFDIASPSQIGRRIELEEGKKIYKDFLASRANGDFRGLKIVVDSANGAGYELAPLLFSELGADVVAINVSPDGRNINADCGAVHPKLMAEKVVESGAILGVSLDGDGDRAIFSDEKGRIVKGDGVLYILAKYMKEKGILREPVITTHMTNYGIELAFRELGIEVVKVPVGDKYVAEKMRETGANLGGEQSGHIILFDHLPTGDGMLTAIKLIEVMLDKGKTLSELCDYTLFPQKLVNIPTKEPKRWERDGRIRQIVEETRRNFGDKVRIFVRASGTERCLRVMVEGESEEDVEKITSSLVQGIEGVIREND